MKRVISVAVAAFIAVAVGSVSGLTLATFTDSAANSGMSVGTKRVFPGVRTLAAYSIRDNSSASTNDRTNEFLQFNDSRSVTSGTWPHGAFDSARFLGFRMSQHLAGGLATSGVELNLASSYSGAPLTTLCYYVQTRLVSTGTVLTSHPTTCVAPSLGPLSTTVALPEVTSTDIANDVEVRIYAHTTLLPGGVAIVDQATVTGSTPYGAFTQPPYQYEDATAPSPAPSVTTPWSLALADASNYRSDGRWGVNFNAGRYIDFDVDSDVPAAAVITSATLTHSVREADGADVCWFVQTWTTVLVGQHGSELAPFCSSGASFGTQVISLPEINTPAEANALTMRVFAWIPSAGPTRDTLHDVLTVGINYHLD
jgi:hypothetical protein